MGPGRHTAARQRGDAARQPFLLATSLQDATTAVVTMYCARMQNRSPRHQKPSLRLVAREVPSLTISCKRTRNANAWFSRPSSWAISRFVSLISSVLPRSNGVMRHASYSAFWLTLRPSNAGIPQLWRGFAHHAADPVHVMSTEVLLCGERVVRAASELEIIHRLAAHQAQRASGDEFRGWKSRGIARRGRRGKRSARRHGPRRRGLRRQECDEWRAAPAKRAR